MVKTIAILLPFIFFISCMNTYERDVIGSFIVSDYTLKDSTINTILPTLLLKSDKTFIITQKEHEINGTWEANDYGDFTIIKFKPENANYRSKQQGRIINSELISIEIPSFIDTNLYELTFKRNN